MHGRAVNYGALVFTLARGGCIDRNNETLFVYNVTDLRRNRICIHFGVTCFGRAATSSIEKQTEAALSSHGGNVNRETLRSYAAIALIIVIIGGGSYVFGSFIWPKLVQLVWSVYY